MYVFFLFRRAKHWIQRVLNTSMFFAVNNTASEKKLLNVHQVPEEF